MSYVTINGQDYEIPEVTFDTICKLEEGGISLMDLSDNKRPKFALLSRAFVAWILDVDTDQASAVLQEHIKNGGNVVDILNAVYRKIAEAGFFGQSGDKETDKVEEVPQNREQRRQADRNRKRNTTHLQK